MLALEWDGNAVDGSTGMTPYSFQLNPTIKFHACGLSPIMFLLLKVSSLRKNDHCKNTVPLLRFMNIGIY